MKNLMNLRTRDGRLGDVLETLESRRYLSVQVSFGPGIVDNPTTQQVVSFTIARLNTGTIPDLAINYFNPGILLSTNSYEARLRQGNGTFVLRSALRGFTPNTATVATGDYNGDGARDLFTGSVSSDILNNGPVLAYRGDTLGDIYGNFFNGDVVGAGTYSGFSAFTTADFDGDGRTDVAAISNGDLLVARKLATSTSSVTNLDSSVFFLTVNGIRLLPSSSNFEMVSGVQDSSGKYRIGVKARFNVATYSSLILSTTLTGNPIKLRQGDFNGDGNTDVAVLVTGTSGPSINIAMGRGDGTFGAAANYSLLVGVTDFTVGDIDYDSREDVAYSLSGSTTIAFSVLRNRGDGTMERVNSPRANVATELMSPLI